MVNVGPLIVNVVPTYSICRAAIGKCSAYKWYMLALQLVIVETTLFFRGVALARINLIIMAYIQGAQSKISKK